MKKGTIKGFVLGAVVTAMALGMTFTASAGRSIKVDDGQIGIKINKANFTILNTKGVEVTPFVYEGTTYVPLRSFCEALGLDVEYDEETNTAIITQKNVSTSYISEKEAKQAAFDAAKVDEDDVEELECELEWKRGCAVYEIEFKAGGTKYEYQIDALTGKVIESKKDKEPAKPTLPTKPELPGNPGNPGKFDPSAVRITAETAKSKVLEHAGLSASSVTKLECEIEWEDGHLVYKIEFTVNGTEYEYEVDVNTGEIVKSEKDTDDDKTTAETCISEKEARDAALADAGVKLEDAEKLKCKLDKDDGVYEVEFRAGNTEYEYEIDAKTGEVVKSEKEADD